MSWADIPGWSDDIAGPLGFYEFIQQRVPAQGVFVEAGVFMGRSLAYMAERRPDLDVYAVDPWNPGLGEGENWDTLGVPVNYSSTLAYLGARRTFEKLLAMHSPALSDRVHIIQSRYVDAEHPPADLVFIDGLHDVRVWDDIEHASNRLKPGGIIAGHDYTAIDNATGAPWEGWARNPAYPGVVASVDRWAAEHGQVVRTCPTGAWSSCWWLE